MKSRTSLTLLAGMVGLAFLAAADDASAQRIFRTEQLVLDDNAVDGGSNTLTLRTPAPGLGADRTLVLPDADGTIMTTPGGPLTPNQILFGTPTGQVGQNANLLFNPGTGIFNIGAGNFTVDAASGNTTIAGTLTLPTTAAQGDALIASTNAGTTTIDAARIGAGLTDAQVNDNLTINGGAIDATPIGATTPSTGAFTTITGTALPSGSTSMDLVASNGGALETRTVASLGGAVAVSTDATLTGDGTTGNPLSLNEANPNTWTATQTLPTTAAQGDALIASTNAGTTTIDAARIGAGLTDAQVNDNLTINGGTIDATPIGATTPSTGVFTTTDLQGAIANSTGNVTIGDDLTVNGTSTLVGAVDAQAAGNVMGDGTDAEQLQIDGVDGGAIEVDINGDVDVSGTLTTAGFSSGTSGFTLSGDLDVNGNDIVDGTDNQVSVDDDLVVTGASDLQGAISNSTANVAITDNLDMTGNIVPVADNTYNLGSDAARWAEVYVSGGSVHIGPTNGESLTTELSLEYAGGTASVNVDAGSSEIDVTTATTDVNNDLNVDGATTIDNTTIDGTLTQNVGQVTFNGNVDAGAGLDVTGGNLTAASDLTVDGSTTLGDNAAVDAVTINGAITQNGTQAVTFNGAVDGNASGNVVGDGTNTMQLRVEGVATGAAELEVEGDINATGDLISATFSANGLGVAVTGDIDLTGDLTGDADNTVSVNDDLDVIGNVDANAGLDVTGGNLTVTGSNVVVDDGHLTSTQTTAPGVTATAAATATLANATDAAGLVQITTTVTPAIGAQVTVDFDQAYGTAPIVVLTPANSAAAGIGAYVTRTTTGFTVNFMGLAAASTAYDFFYMVIETQ